MRAPLIAIRCDCGELRRVAYGEVWRCEKCRRRWNTAQIPEAEYFGIMKAMRRARLQVVAVALLVVAVFVPLTVLVSQGLFLFIPVLLGAWFIWYMPFWRRRLRRRARELPTWTLKPE